MNSTKDSIDRLTMRWDTLAKAMRVLRRGTIVNWEYLLSYPEVVDCFVLFVNGYSFNDAFSTLINSKHVALPYISSVRMKYTDMLNNLFNISGRNNLEKGLRIKARKALKRRGITCAV